MCALVIIRGGGRSLVIEEVGGGERGGNLFKGQRRLGEVETIGKIIGGHISVAERR